MYKFFLFGILFLIPAMGMSQRVSYSKPVSYDVRLRHAVAQQTLDSLKVPINGFYDNMDMDGEFLSYQYWHPSDFAEARWPFMYLLTYFYLKGKDAISPYMMSIRPAEKDYLAQVAYIRYDSLPVIDHIYWVLIAMDESGAYKLKNPKSYLTRDWERYSFGSVNYIVNPVKEYNIKEAKQMDSFNQYLAAYFHHDLIHVQYYSCGYMPDMFVPQGEDNFFMTGNYAHKKGGNADPMNKTIYSGNNSEYYPHELVHVYLTNIQAEANGAGNSAMAHEGISTYLGGSNGYSLDEHLHILADHVRNNKLATLDEIMAIDGEIGDATDVLYTVGGLIAKITDKKAGYKGVLELANVSEDTIYPFVAKMMGVKPKQVKATLMKELLKY